MRIRKQLCLLLLWISLFTLPIFTQTVETNEVERTEATDIETPKGIESEGIKRENSEKSRADDSESSKTSELERTEKIDPETPKRNEYRSEPDKPRQIEFPRKKSETKKEEPEEDVEDWRRSTNMSIGVWGGMYFPISPSGSNSGPGFGLDGYYSLSKNLQVGAGIGVLPYKVALPGSLLGGSINFSYIPILAQAKYWITKSIYAGGGLGAVLATGDVSGYGTGLSLFGGYAYPLTGDISLDLGLKSYYIKDSKSDAYVNLIPNIGITYKF